MTLIETLTADILGHSEPKVLTDGSCPVLMALEFSP